MKLLRNFIEIKRFLMREGRGAQLSQLTPLALTIQSLQRSRGHRNALRIGALVCRPWRIFENRRHHELTYICSISSGFGSEWCAHDGGRLGGSREHAGCLYLMLTNLLRLTTSHPANFLANRPINMTRLPTHLARLQPAVAQWNALLIHCQRWRDAAIWWLHVDLGIRNGVCSLV